MLLRPARSLTVALAAGLLLGLAACGGDEEDGGGDPAPPADPLSVLVEPAEVAPGGTVEAAVVNETGERYTYGADYGLEREVDGSFEEVDLPDRPVIQIGYVANAGETGPPVEVEVPDDAEPGTWRVVLAPQTPDGGPTGEFEVTGG